EGVRELFEHAGYGITEWRRVHLPVLGTEIELFEDQIPVEVVAAVEAAPETTTYQFIVKAGHAAPIEVRDDAADAAPDPIELIEAKIEDAELTVAEAIAQVEEAEAATQMAREEAAHAMRNFRALLDSRAVRGTAPIRMTLNVVRRLLRRGTMPPPVQAHIEQIF